MNQKKEKGTRDTSLHPDDHSYENDKRKDIGENGAEKDPTRAGYESGRGGTKSAHRPASGMGDSSGYRNGEDKDYHRESEDEKDMRKFNPDETENQETEFRKEHSGKDRRP